MSTTHSAHSAEPSFGELPLATADELLAALQPSAPRWQGKPEYWGFRGQADAAWQLVPSAFRPASSACLPAGPHSQEGGWKSQNESEYILLERFASLADEAGQDVPGYDLLLQAAYRENKAEIPGKPWPYPELLEGLALAQHHHTPTRFLDLTRDPLTAAYFAARDRAGLSGHPKPEGCTTNDFAVWALNLPFIRHCYAKPQNVRIELVEVPLAGNPFIRAQRGIFVRYRPDPSGPFPPEPLHQHLQAHAGIPLTWETLSKRLPQAQQVFVRNPILLKFTLPATEARPLLTKLWDLYRISEASLMPSLDGASRATANLHELGCEW